MIDHVWSVLCSHAIIDTETNNVTLYATLDEVRVLRGPEPGARVGLAFEVVSLWVRSDPVVAATGRSRLIIMLPSGDARSVGELVIDLANAERSRTKFIFGSFVPTVPGRYVLVVEYQAEGEAEWRPGARIPLTVYLPEDAENAEQKEASQPANS